MDSRCFRLKRNMTGTDETGLCAERGRFLRASLETVLNSYMDAFVIRYYTLDLNACKSERK